MTRSLSTRNVFRPSLQQLEDRRLLTTYNLLPTLTSAQRALISSLDAWTAAPNANSGKQQNQVIIDALKPDDSTVDYGKSALPVPQIPSLPILNSNPGAPATLYLNFTGDYQANWSTYNGYKIQADGSGTNVDRQDFHNITTGAYDTDYVPASLNSDEVNQIREIWARVAEDYAPFNLNVTTVKPAVTDDGWTLTMDIGDSHGWYNNTVAVDDQAVGISSSIGAFSDNGPHVAFVFTDALRTDPYGHPVSSADFVDNVAITTSHEAGHMFGLAHHLVSLPDGTSMLDPGHDGQGPIMGDVWADTRNTWGLGIIAFPKDKSPVLQWDIAKIASAANGFGYRSDDVGDDIAHAKALSFNLSGVATVKGIVGIHPPEGTYLLGKPDVDVFSFDTTGGPVTVRADNLNALGYKNGADLMARVELWSDKGLIAWAGPDAYGSGLTANLGAGKYYVKVMSGAGLTDIGGYTLAVNQPPLTFVDLINSGVRLTGYLGTGKDGFAGFAADESVTYVSSQAPGVTDFTNVSFALTDANGTAHQLLLQAQVAQPDGSATFDGLWDGQDGAGEQVTGTLVYDDAGNVHVTFSGENESFDGTLTTLGADPAPAPGDQTSPLTAPVPDFTNVNFTLTDDTGNAHQLQIQMQVAQPDGSATFTAVWDGQVGTGTLASDDAGNIHITITGDNFDGTLTGEVGSDQLAGTVTVRPDPLAQARQDLLAAQDVQVQAAADAQRLADQTATANQALTEADQTLAGKTANLAQTDADLAALQAQAQRSTQAFQTQMGLDQSLNARLAQYQTAYQQALKAQKANRVVKLRPRLQLAVTQAKARLDTATRAFNFQHAATLAAQAAMNVDAQALQPVAAARDLALQEVEAATQLRQQAFLDLTDLQTLQAEADAASEAAQQQVAGLQARIDQLTAEQAEAQQVTQSEDDTVPMNEPGEGV